MTMDLWTDANLSPFMAVTAHWIEVETVPTPQGAQYNLRLRSDLIGFHHIPGHHEVFTLPDIVQLDSTGLQVIFRSPPGVQVLFFLVGAQPNYGTNFTRSPPELRLESR